LHLTVENSPFAAGTGISAVPVCAPIVGMLSAVASLLRAHDVCASETTCAAVTGGRLCCFIV
jgi:predicted hydrocarbon binding protein